MNPLKSCPTMLGIAFAILLFAKILANATVFAQLDGSTAEDADTDRAKSGNPYNLAATPGYDLPEDARDPFFPPISELPQVQDEADSVVDGNALRTALRVSMVSSSPTGNFAIVNDRLVQTGESIGVQIVGRDIALQLVKIDPALPGITVRHEDEEFLIRVRE